jgi:hypothetical protein
VFLLLLCNDRAVLGPWVNRGWLNAIATVIIGVLVVLSLILMISTLFPAVDVASLALDLGAGLSIGLLAAGAWVLRPGRPRPPAAAQPTAADRRTWTMPPLALLERPRPSTGRRVGLALLWVYLVIAVVMLVVKTAQLSS